MSADLLPPLRHPVARVLLAGFVVLHVVLALSSTGPTPASGSALVLICSAAAVVVLPSRVPRLALPAVVAAPLAGSGLVLTTLHVEGWPGYAAWPLGATTFVALALALRGHGRLAWLLLGGLAVLSVTWALLEGAGPLPGLDLVVRHAGTLLLGSLFAVGLSRSASAVASLHEAERRQRAEGAASTASEAQRITSAHHVARLAGPTLAALADGRPTDPGALRSLEGRLRDEMIAPALLTEQVSAALARARVRGVDVVLLEDDRATGLSDRPREAAGAWLADRADRSISRFVARLTAANGGLRLSVQLDDAVEALDLSQELGSGAVPPDRGCR